MKKALSLFLSLILIMGVFLSVPVTVNAENVDYLTFELNEDGTKYQVKECAKDVSGDIVIPSTYRGLPVTKIASNAFSYCHSLNSIMIPDSITTIGDNAFYGCEALAAVYITDLAAWCAIDFSDSSNPLMHAENLYVNEKLITDLEIPNGVKYVGNYAFSGCKNIVSVTLPDSTTTIGQGSFMNCSSIENIAIPKSVISIGADAFRGCSSLKGVIIPNSVTNLGDRAFINCTSLDSVDISENMEKICDWTFANCISLRSVEIPDKITLIGAYAFYNCTSLNSLTMGKKVSCVKLGAFFNCKFKSVTLSRSLIGIGVNSAVGIQNGIIDISNISWSEKPFGYKYSSWEEKNVKIEGFTIYGYNDSEAEKYANDNGFAFVKLECEQHVSSSWITDKAATVNATGSKHKECNECGEVLETAVIPQLKPAAPKLSKVQNTASGVKVTWGAVDGADSYIVYRRTYNAKTKAWGGWTRLADGVTSTSNVDKTAKSGYYRYTVRAVNEGGTSGYDANGLKTYFLATPKVTSTDNTNSAITVKWGKVTGATGYIVYRKTGNGKWQNLGKTTGTSFTDKTAKAGVTYKYTVKAYYGSYVSAYNTNGYAVRRLLTPTLKSVTSAKAGVTTKWNKVTGATGYIVYRKTGNGGWVKLATVSGNSKITYLDKTAKKGVTYTYTVKAYYGSSTSAHNTKGLTIKDKY